MFWGLAKFVNGLADKIEWHEFAQLLRAGFKIAPGGSGGGYYRTEYALEGRGCKQYDLEESSKAKDKASEAWENIKKEIPRKQDGIVTSAAKSVAEEIASYVHFSELDGKLVAKNTVHHINDMTCSAGKSVLLLLGRSRFHRTVRNKAYTIVCPDEDYTILDVLHFVAAAHGRNRIMADAGKFLFAPLWSIPPKTNYLVAEYGEPITFGRVRILVG